MKILLATHEGFNQIIHQELRHVSKNKSGQTCTIRTTMTKQSIGKTMEIDIHGFHYRLIKVRRI